MHVADQQLTKRVYPHCNSILFSSAYGKTHTEFYQLHDEVVTSRNLSLHLARGSMSHPKESGPPYQHTSFNSFQWNNNLPISPCELFPVRCIDNPEWREHNGSGKRFYLMLFNALKLSLIHLHIIGVKAEISLRPNTTKTILFVVAFFDQMYPQVCSVFCWSCLFVCYTSCYLLTCEYWMTSGLILWF